jgi:hypothetical protein
MLHNFALLLGLGLSLGIIVILVLLTVFIFELAMFISAVRNKFITNNAKAFWILGMLLIHPFVAIAYYFTDYKKGISPKV